LGSGLPCFALGFTSPALLWCLLRGVHPFTYEPITLFGRTFQTCSVRNRFCNLSVALHSDQAEPATPGAKRMQPIAHTRCGLFPVRSPLLGKSRFLSSPAGTKMFQFPALSSAPYVFRHRCPGITPDRFPHSDTSGSQPAWRLPEDFRSLPRPSSTPGAKTSTVHP
jgi:hypothetical protein